MKKIIAIIFLFLVGLSSYAQIEDPVHFSSQLKMLKGDEAEIEFKASIDPGWHVYSVHLGNGGPISASFNVTKIDGAEIVGTLQAKGKEIKHFDNLFEMEVRYFENSATFVQKIRFTKPEYTIDCYLEYGACNDQGCLPPSEVPFKAQGKSPIADMKDTKEATEIDETEVQVPDMTESDFLFNLWAPVSDELKTMDGSDDVTDYTLLYILLMGFIGGLLAVCMPCIWPIIPMTVSFFLKRAKTDKRKGIHDAITYGLSIIVIYLVLGLLVTAFFGSDSLNAMSTNAVFNIFLFLLLVMFALSFFGWFEIQLPDNWVNSVDHKASKTSGLLSIFLMAFTLVLVSFSCTAPIIGLLLVETATSGNWLAPALGMFGFALALALPFTLFALFPAWLKQRGLENRVKLLGFVHSEKKQQLLRHAIALLQTSFKEGWGLTVVEAAKLGITTIASDVPGLRDSIKNGETGLLFPVGDAHTCAAEMDRLYGDDELRSRLAGEARIYADEFRWDTAAELTFNLLQDTVIRHCVAGGEQDE